MGSGSTVRASKEFEPSPLHQPPGRIQKVDPPQGSTHNYRIHIDIDVDIDIDPPQSSIIHTIGA